MTASSLNVDPSRRKPRKPKRVSGRQAKVCQPAAAPTDEALVLRARDGDRWAREALFRRYVSPVTNLVTRLMSRRQEADDVVQDTFAEALRDLDKLREPAAFRGWLFRIAVNRVRKRGRRRKLTRMLGLDRSIDDASFVQLAATTASPEAIAELHLVDQVLSSLPSDHRIAWVLRHVQGETLEAVAELTGTSLATVKRRILAVRVCLDAHIDRGSA